MMIPKFIHVSVSWICTECGPGPSGYPQPFARLLTDPDRFYGRYEWLFADPGMVARFPRWQFRPERTGLQLGLDLPYADLFPTLGMVGMLEGM